MSNTSFAEVGTIFADPHPISLSSDGLAERMLSVDNVEYLTNLIISRADPLRTGLYSRQTVQQSIEQYLTSWKNLGKFDNPTISFEGKTLSLQTVSPIAAIDSLNLNFIEAFAETIAPTSDIAKVKSITNPNGLFAQQERIIRVNSKPVPFYERALYKRLNDTTLDQRIDETETPFYRMDKNPRISDDERKKTETSRKELSSYADRQSFSYRMNPKY